MLTKIILNHKLTWCWNANHVDTPPPIWYTVPKIRNVNSRSTSLIQETSQSQPMIQGIASLNLL